MARHPLKIAALLATAAAAVVLFPRGVNRPETPAMTAAPAAFESGEGEADRPAALAGVPGVQPAAARIGAVGDQVVIDVETIPHGGAIFLDSTPLAEPRVVLARSDPRPHDIVARAGCRQAVAEMSAADLESYKGALVLELAPRREDVLVGSDPPGARIRLNGRDTGKITPGVLTLDGCAPRALALERDGYRVFTAEYDADSDFDAMVATLKKVALEKIPAGTLLVRRPEYDLDVYLGERRIGKAGAPIELAEGKYSLTFRNDRLFVHETAPVTVAGGREQTPVITFPALGSLTVHAQPSNCKVYVDGVYVDVTPILDLPIASGGHRVKVVFVPNGAEQEVTVAVDGRKNSLVTVKF